MRYIFLHGLGQEPSSWDKTISFLQVRPEEIACPNLSELLGDQEAAYQNLYQAFARSCETCSEPVHLCGLSLGAVLALHYTIDHPDQVKSLGLIGVQYQMPKRLLQMQNAIFRFLPERSFHKMGFRKRDLIQLTRSMQDLDFSQTLNRIQCDTLVIYGEKDTVNASVAQKAATLIPDAKLRCIADTGHEANLEAPRQLAEILDDFYQEQ